MLTEEVVRLLELAAGCVWNLIQHDNYYNDDGKEMMLRAARDALRDAVALMDASNRQVLPKEMVNPVYCHQCEDWHDAVTRTPRTSGSRR